MVVTVLISIPEREAAVHSIYMRGSAEVLCRIYLSVQQTAISRRTPHEGL